MNLHGLVAETAAKHPDREAISAPDGNLTYGELDRAAGALAGRLAGEGVRSGDRVVVWADKGVRAVVAMQAVLRLGAAYVPVDGGVPPKRAGFIAANCAAKAVCVTGGSGEGLDLPLIDIDHLDTTAPAHPDAPSGDDDLAFVLYTSGSTGEPKGVCISHRNARAFVDWAVAELGAGPEDRFANHAPFTFDLSVLDLYAPFSVGASVRVIPSEFAYVPGRLVEFLHQERISVWYSVPSVLTLMIRDGGLLETAAPESLRAVLFAGEPFPIGYVRRLRGWTGARLLNLYGPTETNVCTFHEVGEADLHRDKPVPVGRACAGTATWAEKPDGLIAAAGEEGELIVSGPTVMLGYWGKSRHAGPFRTGDIVRVLTGGGYDYVGREDHMVKVRGHRIEISEVEAAIETHPEVDRSAVVVTGGGVDARLEAFVIPVPGTTPGLLGLKRHLSERLPRYMIVDRVHLLDDLPRTGNGKVDRTGLTGRAALQTAGA